MASEVSGHDWADDLVDKFIDNFAGGVVELGKNRLHYGSSILLAEFFRRIRVSEETSSPAVPCLRVFDMGRVSGDVIVDYRNGMTQRATVTGPTSISFDPIPPPDGETTPTFTLMIKQDEVGGHALRWDSRIKKREGCPESVFSIYPVAKWMTAFTIYCRPFGLCMDVSQIFDP
jgi:hypothetical protein